MQHRSKKTLNEQKGAKAEEKQSNSKSRRKTPAVKAKAAKAKANAAKAKAKDQKTSKIKINPKTNSPPKGYEELNFLGTKSETNMT